MAVSLYKKTTQEISVLHEPTRWILNYKKKASPAWIQVFQRYFDDAILKSGFNLTELEIKKITADLDVIRKKGFLFSNLYKQVFKQKSEPKECDPEFLIILLKSFINRENNKIYQNLIITIILIDEKPKILIEHPENKELITLLIQILMTSHDRETLIPNLFVPQIEELHLNKIPENLSISKFVLFLSVFPRLKTLTLSQVLPKKETAYLQETLLKKNLLLKNLIIDHLDLNLESSYRFITHVKFPPKAIYSHDDIQFILERFTQLKSIDFSDVQDIHLDFGKTPLLHLNTIIPSKETHSIFFRTFGLNPNNFINQMIPPGSKVKKLILRTTHIELESLEVHNSFKIIRELTLAGCLKNLIYLDIYEPIFQIELADFQRLIENLPHLCFYNFPPIINKKFSKINYLNDIYTNINRCLSLIIDYKKFESRFRDSRIFMPPEAQNTLFWKTYFARYSDISDQEFLALAKMSIYEFIDLQGCIKITDGSLQTLMICNELPFYKLDLRGTACTQHAVMALMRKFPILTVLYDDMFLPSLEFAKERVRKDKAVEESILKRLNPDSDTWICENEFSEETFNFIIQIICTGYLTYAPLHVLKELVLYQGKHISSFYLPLIKNMAVQSLISQINTQNVFELYLFATQNEINLLLEHVFVFHEMFAKNESAISREISKNYLLSLDSDVELPRLTKYPPLNTLRNEFDISLFSPVISQRIASMPSVEILQWAHYNFEKGCKVKASIFITYLIDRSFFKTIGVWNSFLNVDQLIQDDFKNFIILILQELANANDIWGFAQVLAGLCEKEGYSNGEINSQFIEQLIPYPGWRASWFTLFSAAPINYIRIGTITTAKQKSKTLVLHEFEIEICNEILAAHRHYDNIALYYNFSEHKIPHVENLKNVIYIGFTGTDCTDLNFINRMIFTKTPKLRRCSLPSILSYSDINIVHFIRKPFLNSIITANSSLFNLNLSQRNPTIVWSGAKHSKIHFTISALLNGIECRVNDAFSMDWLFYLTAKNIKPQEFQYSFIFVSDTFEFAGNPLITDQSIKQIFEKLTTYVHRINLSYCTKFTKNSINLILNFLKPAILELQNCRQVDDSYFEYCIRNKVMSEMDSIDLRGTSVTPECAARIQNEFPNLHIAYDEFFHVKLKQCPLPIYINPKLDPLQTTCEENSFFQNSDLNVDVKIKSDLHLKIGNYLLESHQIILHRLNNQLPYSENKKLILHELQKEGIGEQS